LVLLAKLFGCLGLMLKTNR